MIQIPAKRDGNGGGEFEISNFSCSLRGSDFLPLVPRDQTPVSALKVAALPLRPKISCSYTRKGRMVHVNALSHLSSSAGRNTNVSQSPR